MRDNLNYMGFMQEKLVDGLLLGGVRGIQPAALEQTHRGSVF